MPALRHGLSGTLAICASVPGEGQDVPQAWTGPTTACYQWRLEAALSTNFHALISDMAVVISNFGLSTFRSLTRSVTDRTKCLKEERLV